MAKKKDIIVPDIPEQVEQTEETTIDLQAILAEPKVVRISDSSILEYNLTLPNGVLFKLASGGSYITSDPIELEFLSMQKGLYVTAITDSEFRRHYTKTFSELPTVYNTKMPDNEVRGYHWSTVEEKAIVDELIKRGYEVLTADEIKEIAIDDLKDSELIEV